MWKPAERIRHSLPEGAWPTHEQAAAAAWFQPIALGPVRLPTRTWVPAMVPWRATEDGFVTEEVLAWYERFAAGRPGGLVVEATGIRDVPSGPLLRAGHDRFVPGLARLVETVRRASGGETRLFLQVLDFLTIRRRPEKEKYFARHLALGERHRAAYATAHGEAAPDDAAVRAWLVTLSDEALREILTARELEDYAFGYRERVTDLHLAAVRELPQVLPGLFAAAAERARAAGFDGVELHFAHAYTLASFLSATNTRDDGWGGTRAGRVRLPRAVVEHVRERVGGGFAVGCRMLTDEGIAGGSTVADAELYAVELARAGLDYLSLSRGGKFDDAHQPRVGQAAYPYTGPSGFECMPTVVGDARGPFGRNVEDSARVRAALRGAGLATPVVVVGGICSFAQAEAILAAGAADVVGSARQTLADPDWFLKMRFGAGAEVRRCEFTNYCEGLDQMHKQVTCRLWDRQGLDEPGVRLSSDGKRRLTAPRWPAAPKPEE